MFAKTGSWSAISDSLNNEFNRGYLSNVAHGRRKPSRRLLRALTKRGLIAGRKRISDMPTKELARLLKERS